MVILPEWLLALALTFFVLDFFVSNSETLTWAACLVIAVYVTWRVSPPFLWAILIFIAVFCATICCYYLVMRQFREMVVRRTLLRNAPSETLARIVGQTGTVIHANGEYFMRWEGELWPIQSVDGGGLAAGSMVKVVAFTGGVARVRPVVR